jgi:HEAT repeat protein
MILFVVLGAVAGVFAGPVLLRRALQWNPDRMATLQRWITLAGFPILGGMTTFLLFRMYSSDGARAVCAALWGVGVLVAALDLRRGRPDPSKALAGVGMVLAGGVLLIECVMASAAYGLPTANFPDVWAKLAGDRAAGALAGALSNSDPQVRRVAARELAEVGMGHTQHAPGQYTGYHSFPASLRPFTPALCRAVADPDVEARGAAILAISGDDDPRAIAALTQALHDANVNLAGEAQTALIQLKKPETVLPILRGVASRLRTQSPIQNPPQGLPKQMQVRLQIQNLFSAWAGPALIQAASDPDAGVREVAAYEIGRLGTVEGQRTLARLASDREPAVRAAAMEGGRISSPRASQGNTLASLLRGDALMASSGGANLTDAQLAVDIVSRGLVDSDPLVRVSAAQALDDVGKTEFGDDFDSNRPESRMQPVKLEQAQGRLLRLLNDPDPEVVTQASRTVLSQRFGMSAVPALLQAAQNREDRRISDSALYALCHVRDRRIIPVLRANHEALYQNRGLCEVCEALYSLGERTDMPHRFEVRE